MHDLDVGVYGDEVFESPSKALGETPNIVEKVVSRRESLKFFVSSLQGPDKDKLLDSIN